MTFRLSKKHVIPQKCRTFKLYQELNQEMSGAWGLCFRRCKIDLRTTYSFPPLKSLFNVRNNHHIGSQPIGCTLVISTAILFWINMKRRGKIQKSEQFKWVSPWNSLCKMSIFPVIEVQQSSENGKVQICL